MMARATRVYESNEISPANLVQIPLPGLSAYDVQCPSCGSQMAQRQYAEFPDDIYLVCAGCGTEGWCTVAQGVIWYGSVPRSGGSSR